MLNSNVIICTRREAEAAAYALKCVWVGVYVKCYAYSNILSGATLSIPVTARNDSRWSLHLWHTGYLRRITQSRLFDSELQTQLEQHWMRSDTERTQKVTTVERVSVFSTHWKRQTWTVKKCHCDYYNSLRKCSYLVPMFLSMHNDL